MSTIFENPGKESTVGPIDERPLTDEERRQVARLLADPFSFPQQFKTWLVAFLEGSDLTLPLGSVSGLIDMLGSGGGGGAGIFSLLPAGCLFPLGMNGAPTGTLLCDGAAHDRVTRKRLFDAIGTSWGAGNGTSTFNVPDFRDRALYNMGSAVGFAGTDGRAFGARGGPKHFHFFQDTKGVSVSGSTGNAGGHSHSLGAVVNNAINGADSPLSTPATSGSGTFGTSGVGDHSHSVSASGSVAISGNTSGGFDQDRPSFAGVLYVINF